MTDKIIDAIAEGLAESGFDVSISAETSFDAIGVDSLGLLSMVAYVEDKFDISLGCGEISAAENIGQLAKSIERKLVNPRALAA